MAEVKALLEAKEIILRGDIRLRIERSSIEAFSQEEDDLVLMVAGEKLILGLGAKEAGKWRELLLKPLPTLADKLGLSEISKAFVIGTHDDPELVGALQDATVADLADAALLIAVIRDDTDLESAITLAQTRPGLHIWCVSGKGKFATISDSAIRAAMRARGFADNKTSGISERLTATRYRMKT